MRVVAEVVLRFFVLAILDLGVSQVEELSELSLTFLVFRLYWLSSHDFETVFLERGNARARSIEIDRIDGWIKSRLRRLIEWLIESHVGAKVAAHAHVSAEIASELIGLHHSVRRESSSIHVCHVWVNLRHSHHPTWHVGPKSAAIGHISCKLSRILSHLGHVLHDLVKLSDRI